MKAGENCDTWTFFSVPADASVPFLAHNFNERKREWKKMRIWQYTHEWTISGIPRTNILYAISDYPLCLSCFWKKVSFGSTSPSLSDKKEFPLFYRTVAPVSSHSEAIIELIRHFQWDTVTFFTKNENRYTMVSKCHYFSSSVPFLLGHVYFDVCTHNRSTLKWDWLSLSFSLQFLPLFFFETNRFYGKKLFRFIIDNEVAFRGRFRFN